MTLSKDQLKDKIAKLTRELKGAQSELDFLNSSPTIQIQKILQNCERNIIIHNVEEQFENIILVICNQDYSDFSCSAAQLKEIGYSIRAFRQQNGKLYVWFHKIN